MNKKIFSVIILLIGVLIFVGVGCGKKNIVDNQKTSDNKVLPVQNEITKGKSIIDIAREKGETVIDKLKYLDDCKKSDQDMQDYCFGLGAVYYRDDSFCKLINNPETRGKCNQKSIDKWYNDLEKGIAPTTQTVPGALVPDGGQTDPGCKATDSASLCKKAMKNSMLLGCAQNMPQEDKDNCFVSVALQYRDTSLCDKVSDSERKDQCKESIETLINLQPVMLNTPTGILP